MWWGNHGGAVALSLTHDVSDWIAVGSGADGLIYPAAAPGVTVARAGMGGGDAAGELGGG